MSFQVPNHYQIRYRDDVIELAQQRMSRLRRTVREDPDELHGKAGYFDRMGAVDANEVTGVLQDITLSDVPLSRRRIVLRDFDWYGAVDRGDKRRISAGKALPMKYRDNAVRAMNRKYDDLIIAASTGNAESIDKDDAAVNVPLPAAQKIAVAASGLTKNKVIEAKQILDAAEIDEDEERFAVVSAKQISDLLKITEATSSDFVAIKALVEGKVDTWIGFHWIRSERLGLDGGGDRQCLFYVASAMGLAIGEDIVTDISPRLDKRGHPLQAAVMFSADATRIEDEKMVEMACQES